MENFKRAGNKYIFHSKLDLSSLRIEDLPNSNTITNAFQISTPSKTFILYASNIEEKTDWMIDIQTAINDVKAKRATFRRTQDSFGTENNNTEAPVFFVSSQFFES